MSVWEYLKSFYSYKTSNRNAIAFLPSCSRQGRLWFMQSLRLGIDMHWNHLKRFQFRSFLFDIQSICGICSMGAYFPPSRMFPWSIVVPFAAYEFTFTLVQPIKAFLISWTRFSRGDLCSLATQKIITRLCMYTREIFTRFGKEKHPLLSKIHTLNWMFCKAIVQCRGDICMRLVQSGSCLCLPFPILGTPVFVWNCK